MVQRKRQEQQVSCSLLPAHISSKVVLLWWNSVCDRGLSANILREVTTYIGFRPVPTVVDGNPLKLWVFNTGTKLWVGTTISEYQLKKTSFRPASVCLGERQVLLCGGFSRTALKKAVLVEDKHMQQLAYMKQGRFGHGILFVEDRLTVFVFGGFSAHHGRLEKTTERFSLRSGQWKWANSMNESRGLFNPCRHADTVYLCSGRSEITCEAMDLQTGEFTLIPEFSLPGRQYYFSAITEDEFIVVCKNEMHKWNLQTKEKTDTHKADSRYSYMNIDSSFSLDGFVHTWSEFDARGVSFNLKTGEQLIYQPVGKVHLVFY